MIEVYYIEDDETIADLVKEYLAQQNCSVLIFRTISEAKRALLGSSSYTNLNRLEPAGWPGK